MIVRPATVADVIAPSEPDFLYDDEADAWEIVTAAAQHEFDRLMRTDPSFRAFIASTTIEVTKR